MISGVFSHRFLLLVLLLAVFSLFPNKAQTVGIKPFPILNFKSNLSEVQLGSSLQLSWTSQNANECIAGADWSGEKSLSGNEILIPEEFGEKVYSLSCSGPGGTVTKELEISVFKTIQGVVVDGYLRDAKVFLDKNSNFKHDNDEFYTFSDDVGVYQIRFGKRLISIEGFDVQTGNYLKNFFMMSEPNNANDFIVISPITTVNAFFRIKEI